MLAKYITLSQVYSYAIIHLMDYACKYPGTYLYLLLAGWSIIIPTDMACFFSQVA